VIKNMAAAEVRVEAGDGVVNFGVKSMKSPML
jgi:hypothetical protein